MPNLCVDLNPNCHNEIVPTQFFGSIWQHQCSDLKLGPYSCVDSSIFELVSLLQSWKLQSRVSTTIIKSKGKHGQCPWDDSEGSHLNKMINPQTSHTSRSVVLTTSTLKKSPEELKKYSLGA